MELKLTVLDRLALQSSLPKEGNIVEMITLDSIAERIKLTSADVEKSSLETTDNGGVHVKDNFEIDVTLNDTEIATINELFNKLSEQDKFPSYFLGVYKQLNK